LVWDRVAFQGGFAACPAVRLCLTGRTPLLQFREAQPRERLLSGATEGRAFPHRAAAKPRRIGVEKHPRHHRANHSAVAEMPDSTMIPAPQIFIYSRFTIYDLLSGRFTPSRLAISRIEWAFEY
jgi:hypothetical protein